MFETYLAYFQESPNRPTAGLRVIEPRPQDAQAQRGNLYILVELMGESPVRGQALRQVLASVQQTYYTARGSLSQVLEQAILSGHQVLLQLNQRSRESNIRAGISCAALVQGHLVVASAGPALAMIATGERLDQFPEDPGHYSAPLGDATPPAVNFYRHQAQDGDVLFLGESDWLLLTDVRTLAGAVANTNPDNRFDVVDYLRRQSNQSAILGLLVVMKVAKQETARPGPGRNWPQAGVLPTAVGATPPVRDIPTPIQPESPEPSRLAPERSRPSTPARLSPRDREFRAALAGEAPRARTAPSTSRPSKPRFRLGKSLASLAAAGRRLFGQMAQGVLPEKGAEPRPRGRNWVEPEGVTVEGMTVEGVAEQIEPHPASSPQEEEREAIPFAPPEPSRGGRARLFLLLALLLPLLVAAIVAGASWRQGSQNRAEAQKLVDLAENQVFLAEQVLSQGDTATARTHLTEAQSYLDQAVGLLGFTDRIQNLSARIQKDMQSVLRVQPLYGLGIPLTQFPQDASPYRVIVVDQDVYMLDVGRQLVEHFRLDPTRSTIVEQRGSVLAQGDVVEGITVGRLVDISWQPRIPGFADKASLVVLDRNNNLFRYNEVEGATWVRIQDPSVFQSLSQVAVYNGRLYLADEQADQIYRLPPTVDGYGVPEPWFDPQTQVSLAGIQEMLIDSDIWVLLEGGRVIRYRQGQQVPFSLENVVGLTGNLVDMTLEQAGDGYLYLADAGQERILVFDKNGNYVSQYRAPEANLLRGLRSIFLDETTRVLFILTVSALHQHPLPQ